MQRWAGTLQPKTSTTPAHMNCSNTLISHISYNLPTFSWRWLNPLHIGSFFAAAAAAYTCFQPLLNHTSCGCHTDSSAAWGGIWSSPSMVARKPSHDCSHLAARTQWRGCHMALVCQLLCLLAWNHKESKSASMSPAPQVSKSLSQREITEKCHTSTWLAPLQSHGFKKQDRQNRLKFFSRSSEKFHL